MRLLIGGVAGLVAIVVGGPRGFVDRVRDRRFAAKDTASIFSLVVAVVIIIIVRFSAAAAAAFETQFVIRRRSSSSSSSAS